jgi:hypothetical protein
MKYICLALSAIADAKATLRAGEALMSITALQRTRRERRGGNPRVPCAGSLSLGQW